MIDELRALAIFAKVVEAGSFRAAAADLKLSPSVVSHHISQLEARLGVALLYRSTRRLSLTDDGKKLFESATAMLEAANAGLNQVAHQAPEPYGKLHLSLPAFFTRSQLVQDIAQFAKQYPKVSMVMSFTDVQQDLIKEGIDLAIRIGHLKDSGLKSKKLFDLKRTLVASHEYIKKVKKIQSPKDLEQCDWIGLQMRPNEKTLRHDSGQKATIRFESSVTVDSVDAACELAVAGLGLATPPDFLVEPMIEEGKLIAPLSDWEPEPLPVFAIWPPNVTQSSLTFRLLQHVEKKYNA